MKTLNKFHYSEAKNNESWVSGFLKFQSSIFFKCQVILVLCLVFNILSNEYINFEKFTDENFDDYDRQLSWQEVEKKKKKNFF